MTVCLLRWFVALLLINSAARASSPEDIQPSDTVRVTLNAISGLQYDIVRFAVPPGAHVIVTLNNTDEMAHNIVFTKPGYREEIVNLALDLGDQGNARGYVPASDKVIAAIPLLVPEQRQTVAFDVPNREGVYPYVCTYPGHGAVMYGAMYVTTQQMPLLAQDVNVPPVRRTTDNRAERASVPLKHPYPEMRPAMYRTFMPDCGPAGIAVALLGEVSYCWDAGACRLRYAWKGGFLDLTKNWAGKGKEVAELAGTVFYRDSTDFPFRIGQPERIPQVAFLGYTMHKRYPTFRYTLDEAEVTERIVPTLEQPGVKRIMTFANLEQPLWLAKAAYPNTNVYCNKGRWEGDYLKLSPQEAENFTVTITEL
ncbi:MAG: plastocyanin/azurin family copper-binding protein [Tunicatimonas sp.]